MRATCFGTHGRLKGISQPTIENTVVDLIVPIHRYLARDNGFKHPPISLGNYVSMWSPLVKSIHQVRNRNQREKERRRRKTNSRRTHRRWHRYDNMM